eukprot:1079002-Rhodomonas_salina.1
MALTSQTSGPGGVTGLDGVTGQGRANTGQGGTDGHGGVTVEEAMVSPFAFQFNLTEGLGVNEDSSD